MVPWSIALVAVIGVAILAVVVVAGIRSYRYRITTGKESLVGETAIAETDINPQGVVTIEGERWQARAENDRIAAGEEVMVTRVDRLVLIVARKSR